MWKAAAPWATPQLCQLLLNGRKNRGGEQVYTSFFQLLYFPPHFVPARTIKSEYFEFENSQGHQGKYVKISFHFDHLRCGHKRFLQHVGKVADFWHQIEFWDLVSPDHKRVGDFLISNLRHPNVCGIKKSSEWIDLVGNPTLSVSWCLMALLGRKKGRAGSHPRAGEGEGEAEEMDLLISSFPIPVLGEVVR